MTEKKRAILFDFDGVIALSEHLYQKVEQKLFDAHNVTLTPEEWAQMKGLPARKFFQLVREKYLPDVDESRIRREVERNLLEVFSRELDYVSGFQDLFPRLRKNYRIGIVTATGRDIMEWIFANTHVTPDYDIMITSDEVTESKPHPEPYLRAAADLGLDIRDCLVVEDSINGLKSGKAAGARVLALTTSLGPEWLKDADFIAADFSTLTIEDFQKFFT